MMNICTDDFVAAVDEALAIPEASPSPEDQAQRALLMAGRAAAVRRAARHAGLTGELALAAEMLDDAIAAHPVTYRTV